MRIGIITPTVSPGGLYRVAIEEARLLSKEGFDTTLISLIKPSNPWNELLNGVRLQYLFQTEILNPTFSEFLQRAFFNFKHLHSNFDLLVCHNLPACLMAYKMRRRGDRIRYLAYIHDPEQFTVAGNHFNLLFRNIYVASYFEKAWLEPSTRILTNSQRSLRILRAHTGLDGDVLYPTCIASPLKEPPKYRDEFFLTVGRIGVHPNFPLLLQIMKRVKDLKLVIAGSWSFSSNKILNMFKKDENIRKRVSFIFNPSDEKLKELYSKARAFLYPGVENFNMSCLEAASNGCPIITAKEAGICEIFRENKYDLFAPSHDVEMFSKLVESLLYDQKRALAKGKIARKAVEGYDKRYHIKKLKKIIMEDFKI